MENNLERLLDNLKISRSISNEEIDIARELYEKYNCDELKFLLTFIMTPYGDITTKDILAVYVAKFFISDNVHVLLYPLENVPLYINSEFMLTRELAKWRLKIGK